MRILLTTLLLFLCQNLITAQSNQYLYQVGTTDSLYSKVLNQTREIYIQLPESYQTDHNQKYPVAYILDGEVFLPTLSVVQSYYSGGFTPEMVLVGISNANNRLRDLTTSKITEMYGMPFKQENGEADNFLKFIQDELIPYVESKYPVTNYRTLIGHSYGGLFTLNALIHHPQVFANYISIDPSLDWDHQKLLKQAETILATDNFKGKSLYMSLSGQLHMQNPDITINNVMQDTTSFTIFPRSNIMFSNLVNKNKQNGLDFKWQFYPNDLHGTIPLPSIKDGMLALFEWYQMENTDQINNPETATTQIKTLVDYRATKLKNHFGYTVPPYPEELLDILGHMSQDMQQPDKAKLFLETAIQYYPQSANAHNAMSDYYEAQNDMQNALKFATKAYQINGSDAYKNRIETLKAKQ